MKFEEGATIFEKGDDAQMMYIIAEGRVKVLIEGKKDIYLEEGELFGEASLHEGMKRSGTAVAGKKTICSILSRKDI